LLVSATTPAPSLLKAPGEKQQRSLERPATFGQETTKPEAAAAEASPTATLLPPTATPLPPTATAQPTNTPRPTATARPTATPRPGPGDVIFTTAGDECEWGPFGWVLTNGQDTTNYTFEERDDQLYIEVPRTVVRRVGTCARDVQRHRRRYRYRPEHEQHQPVAA
jgi:hypothetical protein